MLRKFTIGHLIVALLVVGVIAASLLPGGMSMAAPAEAVLTPVSNNNANTGAAFTTWFSGTPVAADTRSCKDMAKYDVIDFQYKITQSGVNTTTVKFQYSNNNSDYVDGNTIYSGTPVPASTPFTNMTQQASFGRYFCTLIDVTNATPVSVYMSGVSK